MSGYVKDKLLVLRDILEEETDADHGLQMHEIQDKIESECGARPDRKTVVSNINALESYGLEIQRATGGRNDYRLLKGREELNLMELKVLVDLVQSSSFLPDSISETLIDKLEKLCSKHERRKLNGKVIVQPREKSKNLRILYVMDSIHEAIDNNKQIRFMYYSYGTDKKKYYHHWGNEYRVSPYALLYQNGTYTLVAIPARDNRIRMYRVDHMENVTISHADRMNQDIFEAVDLNELAKGTFGLITRWKENVTLHADNGLVDAVIDRFGMNVEFTPVNENVFSFTVPIFLTPAFYGWVASFGGRMKLIYPGVVTSEYRRYCSKAIDLELTRAYMLSQRKKQE